MGRIWKHSRTLVAAAAAVSAAAVLAAPAAAEPDSEGYLNILRRAGVKGSDATLLNLGANVCDQFHAGLGFDAVAKSIWSNTPFQAFQAGQIVEASKGYLCPDVYDMPSAA